MSIFTSRIDTSQVNNIYYDATIRQLSNQSQPQNQQLTFIEQRNGSIIDNCDDYEMSIIRFNVDTFTLPVFFCNIQPNQSDPNLSIYSITLVWNDGKNPPVPFGPFYINWIPQDLTQPVPLPPNQTSDGLQPEVQYYFASNFTYLIDLVNTTFATAFSALKSSIIVPVVQNSQQPFMAWNSSAVSASLYCRSDLYNTNTYPQCQIYFNRALYNLFNSFPSIYHGLDPVYRQEYQIQVDVFFGQATQVIGLNNFIVVPQEYSTINNWTPVSSLVFTSQYIPVIANQFSNIQTYLNGQLIQLSSTSSNFSNVITDIAVDDTTSYVPTVIYNPSAEYRMISMKNTSRLTCIDFQVWWKTKLGSLFPFFLGAGGHASIKILFRKKGYR